MIDQRELSGDGASPRPSWRSHATRPRRAMAAAARDLARPDAARVIVDRALGLVGAARWRRMRASSACSGATKAIHCVGVGGSGMSAIAEVLLRLGYAVSGSDDAALAVTERLAGLGLAFHAVHDAAHVGASTLS